MPFSVQSWSGFKNPFRELRNAGPSREAVPFPIREAGSGHQPPITNHFYAMTSAAIFSVT